MRVGVSISRTWRDYATAHRAMVDVLVDTRVPVSAITVVHGASHLDWFLAGVAYSLGMGVEEHPAEWDVYGRKQAGMIRNQKMVDLGADLWLALADPCREKRCIILRPHLHPTHGTGECARMAGKAGIPVRKIGDGWGTPRSGGDREEGQGRLAEAP